MTVTIHPPAPETAAPVAPPVGGFSWLKRLARGNAAKPWWERSAFAALVVVTGVLYTVGLSASGWANSFYSAAVQAGSSNWEAFFYGSSDAGNSITVDKPPASLWVMDLSVRVFGLNSWAILVPEALMGVATVILLYAIVRRHFAAGTALFAGAALAITPVAALIFRFNNPDALLVLLMAAAVYFVLRGIESGRLRWVLLAGTAIGVGFLTKELQAFLILPVLAAVYLVAAPLGIGKRFAHLFAALGAIVVSAGWWVAVVQLVPASMRPYVGGSQSDSFLQLTFGYNGFGRLSGNETGSVTGGGGGGSSAGQWGATGILRMFQSEFGGQIAWLLPAAVVLLAMAVVLTRHAPRVDARRALILLFGGWMLITAIAFSFMQGIIHPYYAVALAPPIAGTVAMGGALVWARRETLWARLALASTVFGSSIWAFVLLDRTDSWLPWLKFLVVALGLVAAALLVIPPVSRRYTVTAAIFTIVAVLLAPFAYTLQTVSTGHTGSIVSAGPTVAGAAGIAGGGAPGRAGAFGGTANGGAGGGIGRRAGGAGGAVGAAPGGGVGATGGGAAPGGGTAPGGTGTRGGFGGGAGGLLNSSSVGTALSRLLKADAGDYVWVAAAVGSESAAGFQLATQEAVMPLGGFNGSDPSPTLAEFKADVAAGKIHYFIGGSVGQANGGSSDAEQIASWVKKNFTAETVDGTTLYDLTNAK